ncbi:hypothetical protein NT01EI_2219 [Edwardsiella ictaluri 93-146]|uniref:Uncharacterized protein n=1 Tax=Edwardsiella ictaluri (strain 93-146) TaxID=634503 RepID=C5BFW6_EDWI9|nr:hypothetical protein NT01EI_2219 [Edwardsiella ictaluri 93-146]
MMGSSAGSGAAVVRQDPLWVGSIPAYVMFIIDVPADVIVN